MSEAVADLLAQLAGAVGARSICIPAVVRSEWAALPGVAEGVGLELTLAPRGDEQILCELASRDVHLLLDDFRRAPFVLLIAGGSAESARPAAEALLAGANQWLALEDPPPGAELLAPAERALAAASLPGEWRAAPSTAAPLTSDEEVLEALWVAAERDRMALAAVNDRLVLSGRRLAEAQLARERGSAEIARQREAERHELDRARLALLEQRAWVADQANRLAASQSWRVGHRLVRIGRRLTLRGDRGTDLPSAIVRRMEDGDFR